MKIRKENDPFLSFNSFIFIAKNIRTIVFILIVILTTLRPIYLSAFFRRIMSNSEPTSNFKLKPLWKKAEGRIDRNVV